MSANEAREFVVENADIEWPNFSGVEKGKNKEGNRNFCVRIFDEEHGDLINNLKEDGWNIKPYERDDWKAQERGPSHTLQVAITYPRDYPKLWPEIGMAIPSKRRINWLDEQEIYMLDKVDFTNIDVIIRPRRWVDDKTGEPHIKAFLKKLVMDIVEDPISEKYSDYSSGD